MTVRELPIAQYESIPITPGRIALLHLRVGWYLATEFLAEIIGVEEHSIPHVLVDSKLHLTLAHETPYHSIQSRM
jgi:hypothetical protein